MQDGALSSGLLSKHPAAAFAACRRLLQAMHAAARIAALQAHACSAAASLTTLFCCWRRVWVGEPCPRDAKAASRPDATRCYDRASVCCLLLPAPSLCACLAAPSSSLHFCAVQRNANAASFAASRSIPSSVERGVRRRVGCQRRLPRPPLQT